MNRIFDPSKFEPIESKVKHSIDSSERNETAREVIANDENSKWKIDRSRFLIDLSKEYPEIEYTLKINGIPTFPKGNLQAIKAKAKNGKTHTNICLVAASLCGNFLAIESLINKPKILYFATEENISSVVNLNKKVHTLCGWDTEYSNISFLVYSLREAVVDERAVLIEQEIVKEKPVIVFVDGIRDLLMDFNSIQESMKTINWLMLLSSKYNCAIVCVLHENKSDHNMRGHLGTELLNKCSDVLEVVKKDDIFIVSNTESRNRATGLWTFCFNELGLLKEGEIQDKTKDKAEQRTAQMEERFSTILTEDKILSHSDLKRKYMALSEFKENTAIKHIMEMTENGLLKKRDDGKYELL